MSALREILARFGIEVDTKPLEKGNKQVDDLSDKLQKFQDLVAGAFVVRGISTFIRQTFEEGNQLYTLSKRAGIAVEAYQALEYTGELLNVSSQNLSVGLKYLHRNLAIAANGGKDMKEVFERLGIAVEEGVPVDAEQAFRTIADSIKNIGDENIQTAMAMRVFGRSGALLLPMLKAGSAEIDKYSEEVQGLGGGFSNTMAEMVDTLDDQTQRQKMALRSVRAAILDTLLPSLVAGSQAIVKAAQAFVAFNKHGEAARTTVTLVGLAAVAVLSKMGAQLWALAGPVAKLLLVAAVLEDIYVWLKGGDSVIGRFFGQFDAGVNTAAKSLGDGLSVMTSDFDGFITFCAAGWMSIGYMMQMQTAGWTYKWAQMIADLKDQWNELKYFFTGMGDPNRRSEKEKLGTEEEYKQRARLEITESYENDPAIVAMKNRLEQLRKERTDAKDLSEREGLAKKYGGAPEDFTPEAFDKGPMTEPQQRYMSDLQRQGETKILAEKYGSRPEDYWSGKGAATKGMIDAMQKLGSTSTDPKVLKQLQDLQKVSETRKITQKEALKVLEPQGLGDVSKYVVQQAQGPQPVQLVPVDQSTKNNQRTFINNSVNTVNLAPTKGDKAAWANLGAKTVNGMQWKIDREDAMFESEE